MLPNDTTEKLTSFARNKAWGIDYRLLMMIVKLQKETDVNFSAKITKIMKKATSVHC